MGISANNEFQILGLAALAGVWYVGKYTLWGVVKGVEAISDAVGKSEARTLPPPPTPPPTRTRPPPPPPPKIKKILHPTPPIKKTPVIPRPSIITPPPPTTPPIKRTASQTPPSPTNHLRSRSSSSDFCSDFSSHSSSGSPTNKSDG